MTGQRAQCAGCAEWDDEIVLGMMLDGSLWHDDCWRDRMITGRRLMHDKRPMLEGLRCTGCGTSDDAENLARGADGNLWHAECAERAQGAPIAVELSAVTRERMLVQPTQRPTTSVEQIERATYSGMRSIVRDWLLYPSTIPTINSDAAKALNGWPARAGTDRLARVAMALVALKASSDRTDVYSVIAHLDRHDELIGAGGRRYIVSLLSLDDLATMQPTL